MKMTVMFIRTPVLDYLDKYIKITDSERKSGIVETVRSILSILIYEYEDRSAVMKDLENIGKKLEERFEKARSEEAEGESSLNLERYYGENVQQFRIADTELSPELTAATARKEAQMKESETRRIEMDNINEMAKKLVIESEERGSKMSFETAVQVIQIQLGKIKKDIKVFGLDRGTQDVVDKIVKGVMSHGK